MRIIDTSAARSAGYIGAALKLIPRKPSSLLFGCRSTVLRCTTAEIGRNREPEKRQKTVLSSLPSPADGRRRPGQAAEVDVAHAGVDPLWPPGGRPRAGLSTFEVDRGRAALRQDESAGRFEP
jgi:hypothetical protein